MTEKTKSEAIGELQLLFDATPEHNTFQIQKLAKIIDLLSEEKFKDQESDTHKESKKGLSTRLKANTPMPEKELTWNSIYSLFQDQTQLKKDLSIKDFCDWLAKNYNCPTRKI